MLKIHQRSSSYFFFFSSRRRHTRLQGDWSSDVCSSDLDGNLVQLGYGAAQRRIWTAESDQTSAIAEGIAQDKDFTKRLLAACGVPVPEGQIVHSPEEAWEVAQDIGFPVTVKPSDGNQSEEHTSELQSPCNL